MKTWLKVRLIAGFFVTVPAVATAWILWAFWSWIDQRFAPIYERMLGRPVAGLGFLTAVVLIILMGIVARNVAGRRVLAFGDRWLHRVPVFRLLYPSVKMLIDSFSPERRNSFKAVVLVQHPREGAYAFGFVTSHVLLETPAAKGDMVTVFVPSNNLYLGDIIVVPDGDVIHTGLSVEEGIRIILSAGTAERVAGERHSRLAAQRLSKVIETGANVLPFAPALVVPAGGGADAPEVEAEGRQAPAEAGLDHAGDHWAVHITPIERVGMA